LPLMESDIRIEFMAPVNSKQIIGSSAERLEQASRINPSACRRDNRLAHGEA
jgi:hypothetical protein